MLRYTAMQQAKGKIFLAVQDVTIRGVLMHALETRYPGAVEACAGPEAAKAVAAPAVLLTDFAAAMENDNPLLLVLRIGGDGMPLPVRLGAVFSSIARHFIRCTMQSMTIGPWIFFPGEGRLLSAKDEKKFVYLTEKECGILLFLHEKKGTLATRQELLDEVWNYAEGIETHTLETHIYRLRQKIETDPASPRYLLTDNSGYILAV